jgi:hypothetical protein
LVEVNVANHDKARQKTGKTRRTYIQGSKSLNSQMLKETSREEEDTTAGRWTHPLVREGTGTIAGRLCSGESVTEVLGLVLSLTSEEGAIGSAEGSTLAGLTGDGFTGKLKVIPGLSKAKE